MGWQRPEAWAPNFPSTAHMHAVSRQLDALRWMADCRILRVEEAEKGCMAMLPMLMIGRLLPASHITQQLYIHEPVLHMCRMFVTPRRGGSVVSCVKDHLQPCARFVRLRVN